MASRTNIMASNLLKTTNQGWIYITGATGFIGQHVLSRLLGAGHRCAAGVRDAGGRGWDRLADALARRQLDAGALRAAERLVPLECDLTDAIAPPGGLPIAQIVHVAASTRFSPDSSGEPRRSNVEGTRCLLEWAAQHRVGSLHLVSTAYVCGRSDGQAAEAIFDAPPLANNEYETSKWIAERLAQQWAGEAGRSLTVHRPSVVVGEHDSGQTCKFDGFYLLVRATELLSRQYADANTAQRQSIPLRIEGSAASRQNIVPIDWVADMIAGIVGCPSLHGRVYNLVHPGPPTNGQIKQALEGYFGIGGGRFVPPQTFPELELNESERAFRDASRSVRHYIVDEQQFARGNTAAAERMLARSCPAYHDDSLRRLIDYAVRSRFGRQRGDAKGPSCAAYFESFLPERIDRSAVARATAMDIDVRFVIGGREDYLCQFRGGRLLNVFRDCTTIKEHVGYRATERAFWHAISGQARPEELFLSGEADIHGDVEQALKLAVILNEFSREFPCDRDALQREQRMRRSA